VHQTACIKSGEEIECLMKVFISWSGEASKDTASALKEFLKKIDPALKPWVSHQDIAAGTKWRHELMLALESARCAVLCVSPSTLRSPWVLFEVGALSALLSNSGTICPYLIGGSMSPDQGPIAEYQSRMADYDGTWDLLTVLRSSIPDPKLSERVVKKRFEKHWDGYDKTISNARLLADRDAIVPKFNNLDEAGFMSLLRIHFAASAGRLSHVFAQAIEELEQDGKLNPELLMINAKRVVAEGRDLLAPFYCQLVGPVSSFLDEFMSPHSLEKKLARGIEIASIYSDSNRIGKAAFQLIQEEQTQLMDAIRRRVYKPS
jgi:hypothetical protein